MNLELQKILMIETMEQLLGCQKYQKIRFQHTPKGRFEVYIGNILKPTCSCSYASIVEIPITLTKQEDGMIIAKEILVLNPKSKFNYVANVQEIKPMDSDYQSILSELNKEGKQ